MKKFMIFGAMAVVSFAGCKENEPEEPVVSGWVEVDPSFVSDSDYTPASASDAVEPVAGRITALTVLLGFRLGNAKRPPAYYK